MTGVNERPDLSRETEREWLRIRDYLRKHRYELAVSASRELYPDLQRVAGTPLLTVPEWVPSAPVPLGRISLGLDLSASDPPKVPGPRYSELVERLSAPAVFENRPTYRMLDAVLEGEQPEMRFGAGHYFDSIDTGEAVAHEYAAMKLGGQDAAPRRAAIGNPVDPGARPMNVAISALTIRHDRSTGEARFLVHWRDPAKVGHAGGLLQVIPVGVFQPATDHPDSVRNDFSLWRCLQREYAEELLGEDEVPADAGPIDYDAWPAAARLEQERTIGAVRAYCLGMGVDPLTLATDLLCAVVIDGPVFDRVFGDLVSGNAEGELAAATDGRIGHPFVATEIERLTQRETMQAAGAALLALAWQQRATILAP